MARFRGIVVTRADESVDVQLRDDLTDEFLGAGADGTDSDGTEAVSTEYVDVDYSGINYKDGMAVAGNPGVMRTSSLIPGIDLVGRTADGARVLVNGCGIGEVSHGGLAERALVHSEWLVPVPDVFTAQRAAAIGTAGFTAALSVLALEHGGLADAVASGVGDGSVLVTGASGGVGSLAIALLAASGYRVIAATGRPEQRDYLLGLGAADTIDRAELSEAGRPLQKQRWAGVIDSAGGQTLATALSQTVYGGTVAACGMVGGTDIPTSVLPFILRGVTLAGINSVDCPRPLRLAAWDRLARDLDVDLLDSLTSVVSLADAPAAAAAILEGTLHGRTVVRVRD